MHAFLARCVQSLDVLSSDERLRVLVDLLARQLLGQLEQTLANLAQLDQTFLVCLHELLPSGTNLVHASGNQILFSEKLLQLTQLVVQCLDCHVGSRNAVLELTVFFTQEFCDVGQRHLGQCYRLIVRLLVKVDL